VSSFGKAVWGGKKNLNAMDDGCSIEWQPGALSPGIKIKKLSLRELS